MECFFLQSPLFGLLRPKPGSELKGRACILRDINDKRVICRGCGTNVKKKDSVTGRFCSLECKLKNPKKKGKCLPFCSDSDVFIQDVTFKDGQRHRRQGCKVCSFYRYLPKGSETPEFVVKEIEHQSEIRKQRYGESFYSSREWLSLRYDAFKLYGKKCAICNDSSSTMHVDHIKPRSKYPDLALTLSNLQILCRDCNLGKSDKD